MFATCMVQNIKCCTLRQADFVMRMPLWGMIGAGRVVNSSTYKGELEYSNITCQIQSMLNFSFGISLMEFPSLHKNNGLVPLSEVGELWRRFLYIFV